MCRALQAALFLFFIISSPLFGRVNQNGDYQIWFHDSVLGKFNPKYGVYLAQEFRFGNDVSELYQQYNEVMLVCYISPSLEIAPGYKQLYTLIEKSKWEAVAIPQVDLRFIFQNQYWRLYNRNRICYIFNDVRHAFQLRPLFHLDTPFYYKSKALKFFLSEEFFWTQGRGIDQNRLTGGFSLQLGKHILTSAAYRLRNLKLFDHWSYQNVLHLELKFSF